MLILKRTSTHSLRRLDALEDIRITKSIEKSYEKSTSRNNGGTSVQALQLRIIQTPQLLPLDAHPVGSVATPISSGVKYPTESTLLVAQVAIPNTRRLSHVRDLKVRLTCQCLVNMIYMPRGIPTRYKKRIELHRHTWTLIDQHDGTIPTPNEPEATTDQIIFPFQATLPNHLPETIHTLNIVVLYKIRVTLRRSWPYSSLKATQYIAVTRADRPMLARATDSPLYSTPSLKDTWRDQLEYVVTLSSPRYGEQEAIPVHVYACPLRHRMRITRIVASLHETIKYQTAENDDDDEGGGGQMDQLEPGVDYDMPSPPHSPSDKARVTRSAGPDRANRTTPFPPDSDHPQMTLQAGHVLSTSFEDFTQPRPCVAPARRDNPTNAPHPSSTAHRLRNLVPSTLSLVLPAVKSVRSRLRHSPSTQFLTSAGASQIPVGQRTTLILHVPDRYKGIQYDVRLPRLQVTHEIKVTIYTRNLVDNELTFVSIFMPIEVGSPIDSTMLHLASSEEGGEGEGEDEEEEVMADRSSNQTSEILDNYPYRPWGKMNTESSRLASRDSLIDMYGFDQDTSWIPPSLGSPALGASSPNVLIC
ncbi:hypothetical protein H4R33_003017 [Dimargaris cristalligena]|nr:hypothetical protein H4R33_003017 [Dimargaris cristalligena]